MRRILKAGCAVFTLGRVCPWLAALLVMVLSGTAASAAGGEGEKTHPAPEPDLNYAQVVFVEVVQSPDGSWCVYTTVRHNDEGWDHYANAWQVRDPEGNELAWRLLAHPHDDEQPFERSTCGVTIPPGVKRLLVRAKCTVHGFGGREVEVDLDAGEGERFKIRRRE